MSGNNFTKVLSVNDYAGQMRFRKEWEVWQAYRTIFFNLVSDMEVLGVGAGAEATIFKLTSILNIARVWATDLYLDSGDWSDQAPVEMLSHPEKFAPNNTAYDLRRIVVQHMNALELRYWDNMFDGIFSSGSIEHFGDWDDILRAGREMVRVLKPGGIAAISTEFKILGQGDGWAGVKLFDTERLAWWIQESGFELIGELPTVADVDEATLTTEWPLEKAVNGEFPPVEGVLSFQNYLFTSVHLALRKPGRREVPLPTNKKFAPEMKPEAMKHDVIGEGWKPT